MTREETLALTDGPGSCVARVGRSGAARMRAGLEAAAEREGARQEERDRAAFAARLADLPLATRQRLFANQVHEGWR